MKGSHKDLGKVQKAGSRCRPVYIVCACVCVQFEQLGLLRVINS